MDDPLGGSQVRYVLSDFRELQKWSETDSPEYDIKVDDPAGIKQSPFPWNHEINEKLTLWMGDICSLNVDAIVHSTNETMSEKSITSERIMSRAGPALRQDISQNIRICRTGDAKMTNGYKLPSRYIIHTVGPRFNFRYKTAADSALYSCYRSVLQLLREHKLSSLALCCIHSLKRGYPPHEGAHIAIRTVRRFLEAHGSCIERIILVVNIDDQDVYLNLLPLYFPRRKSEEQFAAYHLPDDIGNEDGEPIIPERQIRIAGKISVVSQRKLSSANGHASDNGDLEATANANSLLNTTTPIGAHAFAKMEDDVDRNKRNKYPVKESEEELAEAELRKKKYEALLKKSKSEDLSEISKLKCFYQSGFDKYNRPVMVFIGKHVNFEKVNPHKALLYFVSLMDTIVNKNYVVVYIHTLTETENQPDVPFLKELYSAVDDRYKRNLEAIYILHPTFLTKVMTWFFATFSLSQIKPKIQHVIGLEYLYARITPDQLDLPQFVLDYDFKVNGVRYYTPEENEAIGAL